VPDLDVRENTTSITVEAELPGVDEKDVTVTLANGLLTIKGEKKQEKEEKDEHYYRAERSYGAFVRAVRLPATVDGSKVTASFKNGLLTVTLPKAPAAKGNIIPIKAE
jgi:HSP20 family protein